jgi:hypothetical protein
MKKTLGLWVDHRKAVIVTIENNVETIKEITSDVDKHVRFSSGTTSKASNNPQGSTSEDVRDRQFGNQLNAYYEGIVAMIRDADSIWIFGPGEAKGELENLLNHEGLGDCIVGVETVDKMTNNQIAAKVRDHFPG